MAISDLFKSKMKNVEASLEIAERKICVDKPVSWIRVKIKGTELNLRDFFDLPRRSKALSFGRFYLTQDDPVKTHFAPSLEEAISWFRGKSAPGDGYQNIFWGDYVEYACKFCHLRKRFPITISKVEKLVLYRHFPEYQEMTGWRVIQVKNDILGTGAPTKYIRLDETIPVIRWDSEKTEYACRKCAEKVKELGSAQDLQDCLIFD